MFENNLNIHGKVKQRSSNLHLLIKPNEPISGIRLSSGISHSRKRIYLTDTSARFGFQQLFDNLHDICQMAFSLTLFGGLPFWYVVIRLFLSCCQNLLYPDQNTPSLGQVYPSTTDTSVDTVFTYASALAYVSASLRGAALDSRLLYPAAQVLYIISLSFIATMGSSDPSNALLLLSHSGYTSATFAPSVEFSDPETSWVFTQPQGGR
jgi:hypothetical protein